VVVVFLEKITILTTLKLVPARFVQQKLAIYAWNSYRVKPANTTEFKIGV